MPKPLGMAAKRRLAAQHAERERTGPFPWEKLLKNSEVLRAPLTRDATTFSKKCVNVNTTDATTRCFGTFTARSEYTHLTRPHFRDTEHALGACAPIDARALAALRVVWASRVVDGGVTATEV